MNVEQPRERIRCHIVGMAVNPLPLEWLLLATNLSLRITRTKRKAGHTRRAQGLRFSKKRY